MTYGTGLLTGLGAPVSLGVARDQRPRSRRLFSWRARDASLAALSGQAPTFTRASVGTAVDRNGVVHSVAQHQPRWCAVDTDGDGVRDACGLPCEPATTNLCASSESLAGAGWATSGAPTRVGAARTSANVALDLIGDTNAAAAASFSYALAAGVLTTGDRAFSLHVARGTSVSSVVRLIDATTSADRLRATITWDASGAPVLAPIFGVALAPEPLADGTWRLHFQATGVLAGSAHTFVLYPATTIGFAVANTGDVYVGGVQFENSATPTSYVKTTGVTAARAADSLTYPLLFPPQDLTCYVRFARPRWAGISITPAFRTLLHLGSNLVVYDIGTGNLGAVYNSGTGASVSISLPLPAGAAVELAVRVAVRSGGVLTLEAVSGVGASMAAEGVRTAWSTAFLGIGRNNTAGFEADAVLLDVKVDAGLHSLATMRGGA